MAERGVHRARVGIHRLGGLPAGKARRCRTDYLRPGNGQRRRRANPTQRAHLDLVPRCRPRRCRRGAECRPPNGRRIKPPVESLLFLDGLLRVPAPPRRLPDRRIGCVPHEVEPHEVPARLDCKRRVDLDSGAGGPRVVILDPIRPLARGAHANQGVVVCGWERCEAERAGGGTTPIGEPALEHDMVLRRDIQRPHEPRCLPRRDCMLPAGVADILLRDRPPSPCLQVPLGGSECARGQGFPRFGEARGDRLHR